MAAVKQGWTVTVAAMVCAAALAAPTLDLVAARRAALLPGETSVLVGKLSAPATPTPATPLPAPPSPRAAAVTVPNARVVGLGDSVPAGTTIDPEHSYIQLVGEQLANQFEVQPSIENEAIPGSTAVDLMRDLQDENAASLVAGAGVVIVTVGANDLDDSELDDPQLQSEQVAALSEVMARIVARLKALNPQAVIVLTGYWNVFSDGEVAAEYGQDYVTASDALTKEFNSMVTAVAASTGVVYADVYTPFKAAGDDTSLLSEDGDHPDEAGHRVIAQAVLAALGER